MCMRIERIGQRADQRIQHDLIAHLRSPARSRQPVVGAAHGLRAARNRDVCVAQRNDLGSADDGLQPAAAQPVQRHRRDFLRDAALDRADARQIHVLRLGVDHVAEDDMADFLGRHLAARQRFTHATRAQVGRCEILQRPAEIADRGAHAGNNYHFTSVVHCFLQYRIQFLNHGGHGGTRRKTENVKSNWVQGYRRPRALPFGKIPLQPDVRQEISSIPTLSFSCLSSVSSVVPDLVFMLVR